MRITCGRLFCSCYFLIWEKKKKKLLIALQERNERGENMSLQIAWLLLKYDVLVTACNKRTASLWCWGRKLLLTENPSCLQKSEKKSCLALVNKKSTPSEICFQFYENRKFVEEDWWGPCHIFSPVLELYTDMRGHGCTCYFWLEFAPELFWNLSSVEDCRTCCFCWITQLPIQVNLITAKIIFSLIYCYANLLLCSSEDLSS